MSTITASIVKGNLDFRPFAVYTLCSYFFVILLTPFLIYYWRAWGAMTSMGLFFIFPLVGYLVYNARSGFLRFSRKVSRPALTEQFSYGSLHIYQDSLTHISRILIAAWVVRSLGLDAMGIYQVAITFSTVYLSIPMQAISGYTLPMIASAETHDEINKAVNDSLRFLLFLIVPIIASLMIWPEIFIRIFYSGDFLSAAPILRLQLLGTFFTLMMQAVGSGLSAKGKLKAIFVGATLHPLVFLGISYAFFEPFGIQGIAAGYSLSYAVLFTVYFLFMRHYFKTALYPKNLRLIFASLVWLATPFVFGYITHSLNYRILMFSFAIPWFFISSKDHEREYLYSKLRGIFRLKGSSPGKNKKVKV